MIEVTFVAADVIYCCEVVADVDDAGVIAAGFAGVSDEEEVSLSPASFLSSAATAGNAQSEKESLSLMSELVGMVTVGSAQSEQSSVSVLSNTTALASAHVGHICFGFVRVSCEEESLSLMSKINIFHHK